MEQWLAGIGIENAEALRQHDPFDIYRQLKLSDPGLSLNALYALIGALEDQHWGDVRRERREEILYRLDDMGLAPK